MSFKKIRHNSSAAIPRQDLKFALKDQIKVKTAIKFDCCLLCCSNDVNEVGLCFECFPLLDDEERRLCEPYFWKIDH